jgi:hypothetical protein
MSMQWTNEPAQPVEAFASGVDVRGAIRTLPGRGPTDCVDIRWQFLRPVPDSQSEWTPWLTFEVQQLRRALQELLDQTAGETPAGKTVQ